MKYVNKALNGVFHVGLSGAIAVGLVIVLEALFSHGSSVFTRALFALLALTAFLNGSLAEGGGRSGGKDDEEDAAKHV